MQLSALTQGICFKKKINSYEFGIFHIDLNLLHSQMKHADCKKQGSKLDYPAWFYME